MTLTAEHQSQVAHQAPALGPPVLVSGSAFLGKGCRGGVWKKLRKMFVAWVSNKSLQYLKSSKSSSSSARSKMLHVLSSAFFR